MTTNKIETYARLVPLVRQVKFSDGTEGFVYDKDVIDALIADLDRQLRVATMPTDRATGISGNQSDQLTYLINVYVSAKVNESWKGAQSPGDIAIIEANLALASRKLNEYLTLLRAPV